MRRSVFLLALIGLMTTGTADDRPWAGLEVTTVGAPVDRAEQIVVLLHGYDAAGDDLVYFANRMKELAQRRPTTFVFPHGPVTLDLGGRAWSVGKPGQFDQSLNQVTELLMELKRKRADARLIVGGFSQGAMLSSNLLLVPQLQLDSALLFSPPNDLRVATQPRPRASPAVFLSHGERDKVIPLAIGKALRDRLQQLGFEVHWSPFDGPHHITGEQIQAAEQFLLRRSKQAESP